MLKTVVGMLGAALLVAPIAHAQAPDSVASFEMPETVAAEIIAFFNNPTHLRFTGPTRVETGDTLRTGVAVLTGPLTVAGRIDGRVVVVNGDVHLLPGASVTGDVEAIGGVVTGVEGASIGGEVTSYPERLRYRRDGSRISIDASDNDEGSGGVFSDFLITTGRSYNRVEGLPITFGPRIRTSGSNPLQVHALAIYRTEAGLTVDLDELGYYVEAEQFLGGHGRASIGATLHSLVNPIEDWRLSDLESGLSTFLFHRDFRDHYERVGGSIFATLNLPKAPLTMRGVVGWERHRSLAAGNPWSVFRHDEPWRPQPLVAEGHLATVAATATYDTRDHTSNPSTGWLIHARVEQALDADLTRPPAFVTPPATAESAPYESVPARAFGRFSTGMLDVRRYNRLDPELRLNFRFLGATSLTGERLPPQRQHVLGGVGSLPGYRMFSLDCGARGVNVYRSPDDAANPAAPTFAPNYGCDSFFLAQAELRGKISFHLRWDAAPWRDGEDEDESPGFGWDLAPDWAFFVDAGRGWARDAPDTRTAVDVGAGILVDRLGIFVALPLSGNGGLNIFARIDSRL